jgi:hypothetical protein
MTLFTDPAFAGDGKHLRSNQLPWVGNLIVDAHLDDEMQVPAAGCRVAVLRGSGEEPSVWLTEPTLKPLGYLTGQAAKVAGDAIDQTLEGLLGTLFVESADGLPSRCVVQIPGRDICDD